MTRGIAGRCAAEATGTAMLVGVGTGAIVAGSSAGGVPQWVLALAWFAAVALPIQAFAYVSGAHLNPAITAGLVAARRFPAAEAPLYMGAQIAGAFSGSFSVRELLGSGARLGATLPGPRGPLWVFPLEFAFTFLLMASVLYLTGAGGRPRRSLLLLPAAVVGLSTLVIGPWTGSSLNPARSIAPAVLSSDPSWLWLYLVATFAGGLGAAGLAAYRNPGPSSRG